MKTNRTPAVTALIARNLKATIVELTNAYNARPSRLLERQIAAVRHELTELY